METSLSDQTYFEKESCAYGRDDEEDAGNKVGEEEGEATE
jgi:hypothetical protein